MAERRPARSFRDLVVWQKSHALVLEIYRASAGFPKEERFGLTIQLRRAAVSVPANVAEGFGKRHSRDKARFLNIAEGSLEETRYYLLLAGDLRYCDPAPLQASAMEVSRLLGAYSRAVLAADTRQ